MNQNFDMKAPIFSYPLRKKSINQLSILFLYNPINETDLTNKKNIHYLPGFKRLGLKMINGGDGAARVDRIEGEIGKFLWETEREFPIWFRKNLKRVEIIF